VRGDGGHAGDLLELSVQVAYLTLKEAYVLLDLSLDTLGRVADLFERVTPVCLSKKTWPSRDNKRRSPP
jgi:hypothetical protein